MLSMVADAEMMTAAASDLATIGSDLNAAHLVAAAQTTSLVPAAADEVSAGIANLMSTHALTFQNLAQSALTFHQQFTHNINAAAASYSNAESGIAANLTPAAATPIFPSLSDFFQISEGLLTTDIATGQYANALKDLVFLAAWPITYPVTGVVSYIVEGVVDAIINAII